MRRKVYKTYLQLQQERQALTDIKARFHAAQEYIEMMRDTAAEANKSQAHEATEQITQSEVRLYLIRMPLMCY